VHEILELVEPELIVLRSDPMPQVGMHEPTITRVELEDLGSRTRMTLTDGPYPESGHAEAGWRAAFDKLAALVAGVARVIGRSEAIGGDGGPVVVLGTGQRRERDAA
jgi:hypothetical protein